MNFRNLFCRAFTFILIMVFITPEFGKAHDQSDFTYHLGPNVAIDGCNLGDIQEIKIPDSFSLLHPSGKNEVNYPVTVISHRVFYNRKNLTSVSIPDSVEYIQTSAFEGCSSLKEITLPQNLVDIGPYAFKDCSSLTTITIPEGVTRIGYEAFSGCENLQTIIIRGSVTEMGGGVFSGCKNLVSVDTKDGLTNISSDMFSGCNKLTSVEIADSVKYIGYNAFEDCTNLKNIVLPQKLLGIESNAFANCKSLRTITLPDGLTYIGTNAFQNCVSLRSIAISDSVTTIKREAFADCNSLNYIAVGKNTAIDGTMFNGCNNITDIYFRGDEAEWGSIFSRVFENFEEICPSLSSANMHFNSDVYTFDRPSSNTETPVEDMITVLVDGVEIDFDVNPIIINDRVMVPVRKIFERIGMEVTWNSETNTCLAFHPENKKIGLLRKLPVQLTIGSNIMLVDYLTAYLDSPPIVIDGRTLVPLRAICEADPYKNWNVEWDGEKRLVNITSGEKKYDPYKDGDLMEEHEAMLSITESIPVHDGYAEGYSSSTFFRNIFISQYGDGYAELYDILLNFYIEMMYNDTLAYNVEYRLSNLDSLGLDLSGNVLHAACTAIYLDYPLISHFVSFSVIRDDKHSNPQFYVGRESIHPILGNVSFINYENAGYVEACDKRLYFKKFKIDSAERQLVLNELNRYRELTKNSLSQRDKIVTAGRELVKNSSYERIENQVKYNSTLAHSLFNKTGDCVISNDAFAVICNAVGVPAFSMHLWPYGHALNMVKPDNGPWMWSDVTFGNPDVYLDNVSTSTYKDPIMNAFNNKNHGYPAGVELFGGIS